MASATVLKETTKKFNRERNRSFSYQFRVSDPWRYHFNSHKLLKIHKPFPSVSGDQNRNFILILITPTLMKPQSPARSEPDRPVPTLSPRSPFSTVASGSHRKIAIAVDLSDESAYAVRWAVQNYLRPGDAVILLHVRPTSVLYGADWGSVHHSVAEEADDGGASTEEWQRKRMEDEFDNFTATKASDLAQPLVEAQLPFKIHIVKDHDMKERLCLEVERLGLSAVIMGSRGFGASASKRAAKGGRLGSVSDYCVHHCVCPVVVVRLPEEKDGGNGGVQAKVGDEVELHPVPEEEHEEYHDASDEQKDA